MNINYQGKLDIFPTRIHRFKVNQNLINKTLSEIDLDGKTPNGILNDPKFSDIQDEVLKINQKFCSPLSLRSKAEDWNIVSGWSNVQKSQGKGFSFHNHVDSFVSCVLYLKGSKMSISFRDEPRMANMIYPLRVNYDIVVRHTWNPDIILPVNVGDLLIFPSYLLHEPNTNESEECRVSISYNLMPSRTTSEKELPWTMEFKL
tara:strand:- start:58 stop:666 length:609 start_codon:yes stop_codon:yes gene_type:complete